MALYEFDCPQHGRFEMQRPMAESSAPARCPSCNKKAERIPSAFVTIYKGLGWTEASKASGSSHVAPTF